MITNNQSMNQQNLQEAEDKVMRNAESASERSKHLINNLQHQLDVSARNCATTNDMLLVKNEIANVLKEQTTNSHTQRQLSINHNAIQTQVDGCVARLRQV